ncbi:uncharacterized protein LOC119667395 [Teleopsis dalmanni]|uniref:uncharacterized protein LOC119667395 n=1 Tax=Teleopsis dalmanni TaxID=139649 RepID=UPI0018CDF3BA|nr:uncharacterized protein LOC119667395 [Teleopsis dalmanni]
MTQQIHELNCKDLAVIAFGGQEFDSLAKSALCTLLEVIFKKLNCENEDVIIEGTQTTCIREMFFLSKPNEINYTARNVKPIPDFSKVDDLERKAKKLDNRLKEHFFKIRQAHDSEFNLERCHWTKYDRNFEDICGGKTENKPLCDLIQNRIFMPRIKFICTHPIILRIREYRIYVETLKQHLCWLRSRVSVHTEIASLIQPLIYEIQAARAQVKKNSEIFDLAMIELQEKLVTKMDQVHFPVIKRAAKRRLEEFETAIMDCIKKQQNALKSAYKISEDMCFSCGKERSGMIADQMLEKEEIGKELCFCSYKFTPVGHDLLKRIKFRKNVQKEKTDDIHVKEKQHNAVRFSIMRRHTGHMYKETLT